MNKPGMSQQSEIRKLDVRTLRLSEPLSTKELQDVLVTLTNKLNEVIDFVNTI